MKCLNQAINNMTFQDLRQSLQKDGQGELVEMMDTNILTDLFLGKKLYWCGFTYLLEDMGFLNKKLEYKLRN